MSSLNIHMFSLSAANDEMDRVNLSVCAIMVMLPLAKVWQQHADSAHPPSHPMLSSNALTVVHIIEYIIIQCHSKKRGMTSRSGLESGRVASSGHKCHDTL